MKCIDCDYCKITVDEGRYAEAKCYKTSKRGKIITWACGGFPSYTDLVNNTNRTYGDDRVREELKRKTKAPAWCPCKKMKLY